MKLKLRLVLTISVASLFLLLTTLLLLLNYADEVSEDLLFHRTVFRRTFRTVKPKNKFLKFFFDSTPDRNDTMEDSNRAAEIPLNEQDYEELLENKQFLSRSSKVPYASDKTSGTEIPPRLDAAENCLKINLDLEDNRAMFPDLVRLLNEQDFQNKLEGTITRTTRITLQEVHDIDLERELSNMEKFHLQISDLDLYVEGDPTIKNLLNDMATMPIVHVEEKSGGTQLKLLITYQDGSQAMMKPMS